MSSFNLIKWVGAAALLLAGCQSAELTAAKMYWQEQKPGKAKEQLLLAVEQEPNNAEVHFMLGRIYGLEGAYPKMAAAFERSLALSDDFKLPIQRQREHYWNREHNKGVLRASSKPPDLASARLFFRRCVTIDSAKLSAWRNLAFVYYQLDSLDAAIHSYENILKVEPQDSTTVFALGVLYLDRKRLAEAAELFEGLTRRDPLHFNGLMNLAAAYKGLDRLDGAQGAYRRAAAARPESADPHYNLGNLYWGQQDFAAAAAAFGRAVELDPQDAHARFNLAMAYLKLADDEAALPLLQQLSGEMPDSGPVWRELARIYLAKGRQEEGRRAQERAAQLED